MANEKINAVKAMRIVEYLIKNNPVMKNTMSAHNVSPEYSAINQGNSLEYLLEAIPAITTMTIRKK